MGLGAVLFQQKEDRGRDIVEYANRKLSPPEWCHCTTEKVLVVVWVVGKILGYLESTKLQLYTDNSFLQWLHSMSGTKSKLMHWPVQLVDFDFDICHVPGPSNQAADSLSRHPVVEPEPEKTKLLERNSKTTPDRWGGPVLIVIKDGKDSEVARKYRKMKEWIMKWTTNFQGTPKQLKVCYTGCLLYTSRCV